MSKTVTITGFAYEVDYGYGDAKEYRFFSTDNLSDKHYTLIGPAQFQYTLPENWDPTAGKIARLEQEREAVRKAFFKRMAELEEQISKLQAITYEPEAV